MNEDEDNMKQGGNMPVIGAFEGLRITMNWNDHNPPHFHVTYGGKEATVNIRNCSLLNGSLPREQLKQVLEWCRFYQKELMENWNLSHRGESLVFLPELKK